jgi:hypothetical protein
MISAGLAYIILAKDFKEFLRWTLISGFVFGSLYSLWPIRNYITTGRIILLKTATSGYKEFDKDVTNSRKWLYAWTDSANYVLEYMYDGKIVEEGKPIYLPADVAPTLENKEQIYSIMNKSIQCGRSFRVWQHLPILSSEEDCTDEVARQYDSLFDNYKSNNALKYYFHTPSRNLYKAFFKSSISKSKYSSSSSNKNLSKNLSITIKDVMIKLLFGYRSFLICIGFITLFIFSFKKRKLLPISFFNVFMYFFINFIIRQVEMRYLLQADTVLLLFSAIGFDYCINLIQRKLKKTNQ